MEEAIKKAVEGGYKSEALFSDGGIKYQHSREVIILDPLFWTTLGKVLKWGTYDTGRLTNVGNKVVGEVSLMQWHNLIQHLWEGKSIESFFENLK